MTDTTFPQCRIAGERLLNPDTVERLLNKICSICGVRRMIINGPRLSTAHEMSKVIHVGNQDIQLEVHVGSILLELENRDSIPALKAACDEVFTKFSYRLQEGRFMKTEASLVDYAKYGPDADKDMVGLSDPKSRSGPVILQGTR
jgi:methyl-coenzyme M reductase subunit D